MSCTHQGNRGGACTRKALLRAAPQTTHPHAHGNDKACKRWLVAVGAHVCRRLVIRRWLWRRHICGCASLLAEVGARRSERASERESQGVHNPQGKRGCQDDARRQESLVASIAERLGGPASGRCDGRAAPSPSLVPWGGAWPLSTPSRRPQLLLGPTSGIGGAKLARNPHSSARLL